MKDDWVLLHAGALGDLALTLGLLLRHPRLRGQGLTVVSRVSLGDLRGAAPAIQVQSSETIGLHRLYADGAAVSAALLELIQGRHVLSALGSEREAVTARLRELGPRALYPFDPCPDLDSARHIAEQWRTRLAGVGLLLPECGYATPHAALRLDPAAPARGRALLAQAGFPQAPTLLCPGSGALRKCWPLAGFIEVARRLDGAAGFLVGPVELETWPSGTLDHLAASFPLLRCLDPTTLLEALAGAARLIANDSGPAHVAALLGTPVLTLFGPTDARVWAPLGARAGAIQGNSELDAWGISPERLIEWARGGQISAPDRYTLP